jgi:hypothetical protein
MPNSLRVLALAAVVLGVTGFSVSAAGQRPAPEQPIREHNGSIAGKVIDASGKPVAKATVKLTDSVTQEVSTFKSAKGKGKTGAYKIANLEPGLYTLQAEADGRQSDLIEIKVSNNAVTRQDLKLGPKK